MAASLARPMRLEWWDIKHLLAGAVFACAGAAWTAMRAAHSRGVPVDKIEDPVGLALLLIGALLLAEGVRAVTG